QAGKAAAMKDLIGATASDPSGRAFRGLQRILWDRIDLAMQASDPLRPGQTYFSAAAGKDFMEQNRGAVDVMRQVDPGWAKRVDRLVNAAVLQDRQRIPTGLALPPAATPGAKNWNAGENLAKRLFMIAGGNVARHLGGGHMASDMQATGQ